MKRLIAIILIIIMASFGLFACGSNSGSPSGDGSKEPSGSATSENSEGIKIVATIFPEYDWVKNILGDNPANADVSILLDSGVDLHSFQPTAGNILEISTCDLFVYVGGESDEWVEDVIKEAANENLIAINLIETLGDKAMEEEMKEGMEAEDHHDHEEVEYDEHVWLSLRNAEILSGVIKDALAEIDSDNAALYEENYNNYVAELRALDAKYQEAVDHAASKTLIFGDRFPFLYLVKDYGLDYFAAFQGCSAETEASFETITFLANKTKELNIPHIITIEGSDKKLAETIIQNSGTENRDILVMDSMQSATSKDWEEGTTYIALMEKNLESLKEALE